MFKLPIFLVLAVVAVVAWGQGLDPAPVITGDPLAGLLGGSGNLTFPTALVVSAWLLAKWKPTFNVKLDLGERVCLTLEKVVDSSMDKATRLIEDLHRRGAA